MKTDKMCDYGNCTKDRVYNLINDGEDYWFCSKKHINMFLDEKYDEEEMKKLKTYTHTEEGKQTLDLLSHVISTDGMEIYKCIVCDELFGSQHPDEVCALCEREIKVSNEYDEYIFREDE